MTHHYTEQSAYGHPHALTPSLASFSQVDWWSLGVIMFEMMNGIVLFDGEREQDLFRNILHQPLELPKTMSAAAQDVRLHGSVWKF